jgi:branched-chain amino acid transport system permease protein
MRDRLALLLLAALALALPFLAHAFDSPATTGLATRIVIYAIAASSLNLILGYGGMVSFGHAAYFGLGGYAVGLMFFHWSDGSPLFGLIPGSNSLLVTAPLAMLLAGLAALLIGALSLRTTGVQFIMITLAFAQMVFFLFVSLERYGGDDGMTLRRLAPVWGLNLRDPDNMYWVSLGVLVVWLALMHRIVRSPFGRVLEGIRQNERRMAALGISIYPYKLTAFVIAGMACGLSGALFATYSRFVSPDMMAWTKSGEFMIMVILGGLGTLIGPVIGAAALVGLEYVLAGITEHWQFILGPILVLIVLFARRGLMSLWLREKPGSGHG